MENRIGPSSSGQIYETPSGDFDQQFITVGANETLLEIAEKMNIPIEMLLEANPDIDPENITPGQQLHLPKQVNAAPQSAPQEVTPEIVSPQYGASRRSELEFSGQMRELQMQQMMAGETGYEAAPAGSVEAAEANLNSSFEEVQQLGEQISEGKGPVTDGERQAWVDAQTKLRQSVSELAASISSLPEGAPEREAAKAQLEQMSKQLATQELPVLARLDPEFGKSWNHFHSTEKGSEGAVLATRLKMYGITQEQLDNYVATGEEPPGMKQALKDAERRGEWPALGVIRAAYQMRADYLRATTPDDPAALKQADQFDAAAKSLSQSRAAIHMSWGEQTFSKLDSKYPDPATRPPNIQRQIDAAKGAVASVRQDTVDKVNAHPERYGKNSPTRRLAADSLNVEAGMMTTEAQESMNQEAKKLAEDSKKIDPKITPPPPQLHPDLAEGGAVDQKRGEAVKIDPSIGDVVHGGDRAVRYVRDGHNIDKLRLGIEQQQLSHLTSKGERPPAEMAANVNRKLETIFKNELEIHDKLAQQKAGTLSLAQTQFMGELGTDVAAHSRQLSDVANQKSNIEAMESQARTTLDSLQQQQQGLKKAVEDLDKAKIDRVRSEILKKGMGGQAELILFNQNPAEYIKKNNIADSEGEAKARTKLAARQAEVNVSLDAVNKQLPKLKDSLEYTKKVNDLDGLNTSADMAAGLAQDALKAEEAHIKAIPESGPERLPRLQIALDHQSALVTVNATLRDNSDARIERAKANNQEIQLINAGNQDPLNDAVQKSNEYLKKVTTEETQIKKDAFDTAKAATEESENLRKAIGSELDAAQAKLPKSVQQQRAAGVQQYKDALALQQVQNQSVVADLAADFDPKTAMAELDSANKIVNDELPAVDPSRIDTQQAKVDHARNLARGQALAILGNAGTTIAERAQKPAGIEYGQLVVDALGSAHRNAMQLKETMTVDSGGISTPEFSDLQKALATGADEILKKEDQINQSANLDQLIQALRQKAAENKKDFDDELKQMGKIVDSREFGWLARGGTWVLTGEDPNDIAQKAGHMMVDAGAGKGTMDTENLLKLADTLEQMRKAGVSDHVIMATLRDPRLAAGLADPQQMDSYRKLQADFQQVTTGVIGSNLSNDFLAAASYASDRTPLGKTLAALDSSKSDALTSYLKGSTTDLLANARTELYGMFEKSQEQWADLAPIAAISQVVDSVALAAVSSVALGGVFANIAKLTGIPEVFAAARGATVGMSTIGRLATLGTINLAEAGLGMLTGKAIGGIGTLAFGEGSTGAKIFEGLGSGFQLGVASKVALQSGIGFQMALGFTIGGAPIAAQQLGMSPELAENLGTAVGLFVPTVLGTIGNHATIKRAEGVMIHEFGLDPKQARGLMTEVFHAEGLSKGDFDLETFTRERAAKLIEKRLPDLSPDARTKILDAMTLDAVKEHIKLDVPKSGSSKQYIDAVENHYATLETEAVKAGVSPENAHELVMEQKTMMYQEALDRTGAMVEGRKPGSGGDPNDPNNAAAATRSMAEQAASSAGRPPQEVSILRTVNEGGEPSVQQKDGYKLLMIDRQKDTAVVVPPEGGVQVVRASDIVFHQELGLLPPAQEQIFTQRWEALSPEAKKEFSTLLGEADKVSPEHGQLLRKLVVGGAGLEDIRAWHDWAKKIPQEQLGKALSPDSLPQHLIAACGAASAQRILGFLYPHIGVNLHDFRAQALGQRWEGAGFPRSDQVYPNLGAPPLRPEEWLPAQPLAANERPQTLDTALAVENRGNFAIYDVARLQPNFIEPQLRMIAAQGGGLLQGVNANGVETAYALKGIRNGQNGTEINLTVAGHPGDNWMPLQIQDGRLVLPDGNLMTHIAAPPNVPFVGRLGMFFDQDPRIVDAIRNATGKEITRVQIQGDPALHAIYDSVKTIGFAGAVVDGPPMHQLVIRGAHEKGGKLSFDVYDPWRGDTRRLSGDQLLHYSDGISFDEMGRPKEASLQMIQIPRDLTASQGPNIAAGTTAAERLARHQIQIQEPHKLSVLAAIDQLPEVEQRRQLTQLLRKENNLNRLAYMEDAIRRGPDAASQAAAQLMDPNFMPPGNVTQHSILSQMQSAQNLSDIETVLLQIPSFRYMEPEARSNIANLFASNQSALPRASLFEMLPALQKMPDSARAYALERLNSMMPDDIAKAALRLRANQMPDPRLATEEQMMEFAAVVFGR